MQAKRKSIWQDLDLENGYNILETKKPKLKGTKYVRECYARKRLQLKKQQSIYFCVLQTIILVVVSEVTDLRK